MAAHEHEADQGDDAARHTNRVEAGIEYFPTTALNADTGRRRGQSSKNGEFDD